MRVFRRATEAEARAQPFLTDVESIHNRLRRRMLRGLPSSGPHGEPVRQLLQGVLATELAWARRNLSHGHSARGRTVGRVETWFLEAAYEEQQYADRIAARIAELGGEPRVGALPASDPGAWPPSAERGLIARVREDLVAERVTIGTYRALVRLLGDRDPDTRCLLEEVLASEEEHAEGLVGLLRDGRFS